jgi:transcriptional regulator with XRE-family HTH domain
MNARQLSEAMGVFRTYIVKIEGDKCSPTVESLFRFARGLNLSPRFILEMAEAMASA